MQIGVLGPLQVLRGATRVDPGSPKPRTLLAVLTLRANQPVAVHTLVDFLWGERPPAAVTASMHSYIASLRKSLEPDRAARSASRVLLTSPLGYELRVAADDVDAHRFAEVTHQVHARLTCADPLAVPDGLTVAELALLGDELTAALSWWRGEPYAELDDRPMVAAERARLHDLRLAAIADRARIQLATGRESGAVADLAPAAHDHPLREDLWALLALALARAGRQGDALAALRAVRESLGAELGIDPGPTLRDLEVAVLRQDVRRPEVGTAGPVPTPSPARGPAVPSGPPLVGRDEELDALLALLDQAESGVARIALLIGEPGIGKTRLTEEFAARARARGFGVQVGRCSSDEGAPPLWPWVTILDSLAGDGAESPAAEALSLLNTGGADRFARFDSVARALSRIVARQPQVLVFDDLHWADPSTLSLLRHVTETIERGPLIVVVTRRPHPAPTGALADYGETVARRNALRLDLAGLSAADVSRLAAAGDGPVLADDSAERLRDRTGGNPFFLLELLRARGVTEQTVPAAVGEVIAARVDRLPEVTRRALRDAAAAGRTIEVALVARIENVDPDDVLDALEPAVDAGLLVVTDRGELRFGHALVRDAVEASDSGLRRQRRHADVARALAERDPADRRLAEIARHWLQAGPGQAARAWPAAVAAAHYASRLGAHEEAADLLAAALTAQSADPAASAVDRYDLLLTRASACRASADHRGQRAATSGAIEIADELGDVERLAAAAIEAAEGGLWSNLVEGTRHEVTLDALRTAARDLPGRDTALRCRTFLALSRELYWTLPVDGGHPAERVAHAERGIAMARRLGDPGLLSLACRTLSLAVMSPSTLERRVALMEEAVACSRAAGDPDGEGVALFWRVMHAGEAGRIADRRIAVVEAMAHVERHGLRTLQVMLGANEASWLAMDGRFEEAGGMLEENLRRAALASFPFREESVLATRAAIALWRGEPLVTAEMFAELGRVGPTDIQTALLIGLVRGGRLDRAADVLDRSPTPLDPESFAAPFDFAILAEVALELGRRDLAGRLYPLMLPWAGRIAAAGTGPPLGPIDAFLAAAAATVGEIALATRHADAAARLCTQWRIPLVAAWLADLRARFGF